jgi:hypothetical protein
LREGLEKIIKEETELVASVMCYSQSDSSKFSRFFSMSVRKEEQVTELIDLLELGTELEKGRYGSYVAWFWWNGKDYNCK